jgi:hypothetical protein
MYEVTIVKLQWAYSGLQGVYAMATGGPRLRQGQMRYITQTFVHGLRISQ